MTPITTPLGVLLVCASFASASTNALSVRVETADGSTLIGEPMVSNIQVRTSFADIALRLDQVASFRFTGTNGAIAVRLRNGDSLSGETGLRELPLLTVIGKVTVPAGILQAISILAPGSSLPGDLLESLVLHYSFDSDEGERVTDRSPKANHGKTVGSPTFTPDGKVGGALVLDGVDDFIDAGNPPSLRLERDFTLATWVRFDSLANSAAVMGKSSNPQQDGRSIEMYVSQEQSVCGYFWQDGNQFFSATGPRGRIALSKWHHVVMQHDSTLAAHQIRFYLDGAEHAVSFGYETVPSIPRIRQTQEPFRAGCFRQGSHQFKGRIDEVMIFNRVLTAAEVKTVYESSK